jgi:hypothetical protein
MPGSGTKGQAKLGLDHPDVAAWLGNLAATYRDLERAADVLPLSERALAITQAALGPDQPDVAIRLENLAVTYRAPGATTNALFLEEQARQIRSRRP